MKIAFDSQAFTNQPYGGISRYFTILARELISLGQDVNVYAGIHRNHYLNSLPVSVVSGCMLESYPQKTGRVFGAINHCFSEMLIKNRKPNIVHETYYSDRLVLKSSVARIATIHDMIHEIFPSDFSTRDKTSQWKRQTLDRVDHIISISESTKKDLVEIWGIDQSKISVVHHGVDISAFENLKKRDSSIKKPFLLYVGNRTGYKNFDAFIKAFSASVRLRKDFNIVVCS